MESIAVTKPDIGVLSRDRLPLSPFGMLAQAFAEELLARSGWQEGAWSFVPLDLLEETEPSAAFCETSLHLDLRLVLEALRRDNNRSEQQRTVERIVERVLRLQREPSPSSRRAGSLSSHAALRTARQELPRYPFQTAGSALFSKTVSNPPTAMSRFPPAPSVLRTERLARQTGHPARPLTSSFEQESAISSLLLSSQAVPSQMTERPLPLPHQGSAESGKPLPGRKIQDAARSIPDSSLLSPIPSPTELAHRILPEEPSDKTSSPGPSPRHTQPVHPAQTDRTASTALAQGVQSPPSPAHQIAPATAIRDIRARPQAISGQSEQRELSPAEPAAADAPLSAARREIAGIPLSPPTPAPTELAHRILPEEPSDKTSSPGPLPRNIQPVHPAQTAQPGRTASASPAQGVQSPPSPARQAAPATAIRDIRTRPQSISGQSEQREPSPAEPAAADAPLSAARREAAGIPLSPPSPAPTELAHRILPEEPSDKTSSPGPSPRHTQPVHPAQTAQTGRTASASPAQGVQSPPSPARQTAPVTAIRNIRTRPQSISGQSEQREPSPAEQAAPHGTAARGRPADAPLSAARREAAGIPLSPPIPSRTELAHRILPEEPSDKTSSPGPSPRHTQSVHPAQTGRTASASPAQGVQSSPSPARQAAPATAIRDIRTRPQALSGQSEPPRPSLAESAARHSISVSAPLIAFSPWFDRAQHPQGTDAFSPAKMLLSGPADPQQALSGPANLQAPSGSTASPNFQESIPLTYGAVRTSEPPSEQAAGSSPAQPESEFARSLPDWARNFLRNNTAASRAAPSAAAVHPSISPSAAQQPIQWTAPNYRPADPPIAYREKNKEEPVREKREASISEAQLQRTADRIYQIIEDRIRRERRRLGL